MIEITRDGLYCHRLSGAACHGRARARELPRPRNYDAISLAFDHDRARTGLASASGAYRHGG